MNNSLINRLLFTFGAKDTRENLVFLLGLLLAAGAAYVYYDLENSWLKVVLAGIAVLDLFCIAFILVMNFLDYSAKMENQVKSNADAWVRAGATPAEIRSRRAWLDDHGHMALFSATAAGTAIALSDQSADSITGPLLNTNGVPMGDYGMDITGDLFGTGPSLSSEVGTGLSLNSDNAYTSPVPD